MGMLQSFTEKYGITILSLMGLAGALIMNIVWFIPNSGSPEYPAQIHSEQSLSFFIFPILLAFFYNRGFFTERMWNTILGFPAVLLLLFTLIPLAYLTTRIPFYIVSGLLMLSISLEIITGPKNRTVASLLFFLAMILGLVGYTIMPMGPWLEKSHLFLAGKGLLYYGSYPLFFLSLVIHIIENLSGEEEQLIPRWSRSQLTTLLFWTPILYILTYMWEIAYEVTLNQVAFTGYSIRWVILLYWFVHFAKPAQILRLTMKGMALPLLTGSLFMFGGLLYAAINPDYKSHLAHIFFIGGFAPLLLYTLLLEITSYHTGTDSRKKVIFAATSWMVLFFILSAISRGLADPDVDIYRFRLTIAATLFSIAVLSGGIYILFLKFRNRE